MPKFIEAKLKWKFLLGLFICTAIAGLAGLAGIVSLGQIQSNMKKTTMETLDKQLTQTQQVMPLRSFAISIISASKREELEEINKKLQQLQREDTLITGEQQIIENSIKILLSQKSNQISTLSNLAGLRKSNTATLNEVINLAINIVDNAEFDSAVKMDDAITEIRGNISTMATSSLIYQQIKKISDTAEKAISTIKSALSVRSLCNELNAMVKETLAAIDVASVDYAKIEITTLLGNTKNELAILPRDETTKNISPLLGNFAELVDKMVEAKKQVLFAEDALNETSAKIWEQMRKVDNTMLEAAQNMKLNADRAFKTSKSLVNRWQSIVVLLVIGSLILAIVAGVYISGLITSPIIKVVELANSIAKGDLSQRLNMTRKDEIGNMADALDDSCKNLADLITQIRGNADVLATSSEEMSTVSAQMASNAEEMSTQSDAVAGTTEQMSANINAMASAAEEMSVNIQSVTSTAEQMSQNMNTVATAIEEMSSSIKEVAGSAQEGAHIADTAMEISASATKTMNVLGQGAKEIGQVTDLIKRIAEQTNLLALNATIEAASAGDAGKGFAVVANEIKELASQSAQAAEDIAKRIEGVQGNTEEAVKSIGGIADIINKINESSTVITKSVEQQTITATEISGNVQQANTGASNIASSIAEVARGANDVSRSAAEAAKGINEVSENIQGVSKAAGDSNAGAQQVNSSANELAKMSTQIQEMVGRFTVDES